MKIGGLQKLTMIDYPGKISCTVFSVGCNYRCPWCYNPELVLSQEVVEGLGISEKDFFKFLEERKNMLEGVCICGGEPTVQPDLQDFCHKIKALGYAVKLDTNGSNPKILKTLIDKKLVDYVALDVKAPKEKYAELIGFQGHAINYLLQKIEESIKLLKESEIEYEFRTTLVPVFLTKEDILKIVQWLKPAKKYFLQNFRREKTIDPSFLTVKPYPQETLFEIKEVIAPFFEVCQVR